MIESITSYAKSKKIDYEIYYVKNFELGGEIFKNKVGFVSAGTTEGFGIRVALGKKVGLASTNDIENYKECVDTAIKIAKVSNPDENFNGFAAAGDYTKIKTFDPTILDITAEDFVSLNKDVVSELQSVDPAIMASLGGFSKTFSTRRIVNSNGVDCEEEFCGNSLDMESITLDGISIDAGIALNKPIKPEIGKEFAERLIALKDRKSLGIKPEVVVLHREALVQLFGACLEPAIDAENVIEHKSPFKIGQEVGNITITDDGTIPMYMGSSMADDEGTPSNRTEIVKDGILKNYLQNSYSSSILEMPNTGNAARTVSTKPGISSSNILMEPGELKDKPDGLLVNTIMGAHTIDFSSGDFSVSVAEGFVTRNNEKEYPVKDTMIAGNFFEMLKDIEVFNDQALCYHGEAYYLPSVAVKGLTVVGKSH